MDEKKEKLVCVTGGDGFVASWLVMKLPQHGYSVNATVKTLPSSGSNISDLSYLTNLPFASEKLHIFTADLEHPESFRPAIEGCTGVFHVAHPMDFKQKETEQTITERSVKTTLGILQSCLDSKTVKRVVYTSSVSTVLFNDNSPDVVDEASWTDVDYIRKTMWSGASYGVSKKVTERAAIEFGEKHCLDVVTVIPGWIHGPFICPYLPGSVWSSLAMFLGNENLPKYGKITPYVHIEDTVNAHIFLLENPEAKGRYICSAVDVSIDELSEFVSWRYPLYQMRSVESLFHRTALVKRVSSKKLLDAGFRYKYGLDEMFDDAIECCKNKGFL